MMVRAEAFRAVRQNGCLCEAGCEVCVIEQPVEREPVSAAKRQSCQSLCGCRWGRRSYRTDYAERFAFGPCLIPVEVRAFECGGDPARAQTHLPCFEHDLFEPESGAER